MQRCRNKLQQVNFYWAVPVHVHTHTGMCTHMCAHTSISNCLSPCEGNYVQGPMVLCA